ncbi:RNase P subunit p30 [Whalleya microplaca]|nr:RNase P subunit p30 [Whalleya microplaca]
MLYDLNIAWSPSTTRAELERTLKFSASLGYHAVALNHTIDPPITGTIVNPLPRITSLSSSTSSTSTTTSTSTSTSQSQPTHQLPTILHRATLTLSDPSTHHRLPQLASAYDILAVRPTTERAFNAACLSIAEASLISLDLSARHPFYFRPKACMAAVKRGARFEICYAQALGPGGQSGGVPDARARATFIGNVAQLVRATRGRGIVISSEAADVSGLRAPADVVNLLAVWGLPPDRGVEALGARARAVVVNEGIRRSGFRGVVDILGVAEREGEGAEKGDGDKGTGQQKQLAVGVGKKKEKRKGGQQQAGNSAPGNDGGDNGGGGGRKRKSEDGDEGDQPQQQPPMSKRQAKKLKKAAALREKPPADQEA